MNTNLKILVVDDTKSHRKSAEILLAEHDLTIVGSYDDAVRHLRPVEDYSKSRELRSDLLEKAGLSRDFYPYSTEQEVSESDKAKYRDAEKEAGRLATTYPDFDVVLLDLLMPASRNAQGDTGMKFVGGEMPVGTFLILLAIRAKIKNIGMVTDTNHHNHPASACLDPINREVIEIGDTRIHCTNYPDSQYFDTETGEVLSYDFRQSDEGKEKYPRKDSYIGDYQEHEGAFIGKGWNTILKTLLEDNS